MPPHKKVSKAITESMVMVAAADGQIHKKEQVLILTSLKEIWSPGYGGLKSAVVAAFRDVKLAHDFGMNIKKLMETHATLLAKIFTGKEKKYFLDRMEALMRVDDDLNRKELDLYKICRTHIRPDMGLMGALKSLLGK